MYANSYCEHGNEPSDSMKELLASQGLCSMEIIN